MKKDFYVVVVVCKAKKSFEVSSLHRPVKEGEVFTRINWELFHTRTRAFVKSEWLKEYEDEDYFILDAYPYKVTDMTFFCDFKNVSDEK